MTLSARCNVTAAQAKAELAEATADYRNRAKTLRALIRTLEAEEGTSKKPQAKPPTTE